MLKLCMLELSEHTKFLKIKVLDDEIAHADAMRAYEILKNKGFR